ncbi:MAG: hypothetical protein ACREU7_03170, partial [Burkholderiales bacterium]
MGFGHRSRRNRGAAPLVAVIVALGAAGKAEAVELVPELTAYYTSLGLYIPLTGRPIPESRGDDELEIYRELLLTSLRPQLLLLEASVYPMPILGTWVRRNEPGLYEDANLRGDLNWIESATAGLQEPAAVSVFLGSAMNLVRPGEKRKGTNKGHMGYLASVGDRHIVDNLLIDDNWYELEWKLKGEREFADDHLSWRFRLGTQQHSHPEIADTVYVGLRRGNLDYRAPFLAWLTNSSADFSVGATASGLSLARTELLLEKRYPLPQWGFALALEAGFIYESNRAYV